MAGGNLQLPAISSAPFTCYLAGTMIWREWRSMEVNRQAKFQIGQVVRHRFYAFRGVIFDVDPTFNNSDEWWESIPEDVRPRKDQPYYHLLAENAETEYVAYVSEQNLLADETGEPVRHPQVGEFFGPMRDGVYAILSKTAH